MLLFCNKGLNLSNNLTLPLHFDVVLKSITRKQNTVRFDQKYSVHEETINSSLTLSNKSGKCVQNYITEMKFYQKFKYQSKR